ncbi:hypothetical protein CSUB01_05925 [Colletotrichum sublineola]|uniref:Transmembrane protein n=1 Tax=Colletotrichum sublineola TaxID=1173701 RepID=A0A066XFU7_COLSU|nr:hypothetical protein CSUB01_05925 [Colletotrichum sublineola]
MAAALRFTYLPVIPSPFPTPSFTIQTYTSTVLAANGVSSMTTVVGLGPRAVSYTTVYVTPTPSATATSAPEKPEPVYGDLTWSYVVLLCVPFVVLAIALYANHRDRRRHVADQDIEMQSFQKFWFPWRELDPGEVPNEVSRSADVPSPPAAAASGASVAQGHVQKERRYAWHPFDESPMPPVTLYSDPPSQAAVADYYDQQIYGRTGSRRNADPEDLAEDDEVASDKDSITAMTGRASPDIGPKSDDTRNGGKTETASPNPWAAHIPSYYGNLPFPVSPVSTASPSQGTSGGAGSSNAGKAQIQPGIQTTAQRRAVRSRNRFAFSSSSSEDEADGQPAEPQHSYYADPSTRAGKRPVKL